MDTNTKYGSLTIGMIIVMIFIYIYNRNVVEKNQLNKYYYLLPAVGLVALGYFYFTEIGPSQPSQIKPNLNASESLMSDIYPASSN